MKLQRPTVSPIAHWSTPPVWGSFRVTSPFGPRADGFHGALDIGNGRLGDPVLAAGAGFVLAAGYLGAPWSEPTTRFPSGNYGGMMAVIQHAPRVVSIYAHMAPAIAVRAGQAIGAGERIGSVGDTGSAAPPPLGGGGHLHFGIQAPAAAVPAGVATRSTPYGYGLDVDPWPLITGAAALQLQEDPPMPILFGGGALRHDRRNFTALAGARFRELPQLDAAIIATLDAGAVVPANVRVTGASANGSTEWIGTWLYTGDPARYRFGFLHRSALVEVPDPPDTAAADLAALREAIRRLVA